MKMSKFLKRFCSCMMAIAMLFCVCTTASATSTDGNSYSATSAESFGTMPLYNWQGDVCGPIAIGTSAAAHPVLNPYIGTSKTLTIMAFTNDNYAFSGRVYGNVSKNGKDVFQFSLTHKDYKIGKKLTLPSSGEYLVTAKNETDTDKIWVSAEWT